MSHVFDFCKGKVRVLCNCGYQSEKLPDMSGAKEDLSRHNLRFHPGVFPRWNPDKRVVEDERAR